MKKYSPLLSVGFVLGLFLLLLNDFYLKAEFHNALTGKLSDFAGLFIFPMFWATLFPKFKDRFYIGTALFFLFWKTPASQPLIDVINRYSPLSLARVVDYTDYIALLILPLSYAYFHTEKKTYLKINPIYIGALACFAFMATSDSEFKEEQQRKEIEHNNRLRSYAGYFNTDIESKTYYFDYSLDLLEKKFSQINDCTTISQCRIDYEAYCNYGFGSATIETNLKQAPQGSSLTTIDVIDGSAYFGLDCKSIFQWQPTKVVLRRLFERQVISKLSDKYQYLGLIYCLGVNIEGGMIFFAIFSFIFIASYKRKKDKLKLAGYIFLASWVIYFLLHFLFMEIIIRN